MQSFISHWNKFLKEGIDPETGEPDFKYYAFDWDDNIMMMPTKILVKDSEGNVIGISTEEFAHLRADIGVKPEVDYEGHKIVGYAPEPFRNFRTEGDKQFIEDSKTAPTGPAWGAFVECLNGGSVFAIITARGHNPETLRQAVYNLIVADRGGISKKRIYKSLKKYSMYDTNLGPKELINEYLNKCQFSPVSYDGPGSTVEASATGPEKAKEEELRRFMTNIEQMNAGLPTKLGFSDDDKRNIEHMSKIFSNKDVKLFYTGPEKDYEPEQVPETIPDSEEEDTPVVRNKQLPRFIESKNRVNRTLKEGIATKMFRTKSYKQK